MSESKSKPARTFHFPLCDRGKDCPNQDDTQESIGKDTTRYKPKAKINQRDEESGREEE